MEIKNISDSEIEVHISIASYTCAQPGFTGKLSKTTKSKFTGKVRAEYDMGMFVTSKILVEGDRNFYDFNPELEVYFIMLCYCSPC